MDKAHWTLNLCPAAHLKSDNPTIVPDTPTSLKESPNTHKNKMKPKARFAHHHQATLVHNRHSFSTIPSQHRPSLTNPSHMKLPQARPNRNSTQQGSNSTPRTVRCKSSATRELRACNEILAQLQISIHPSHEILEMGTQIQLLVTPTTIVLNHETMAHSYCTTRGHTRSSKHGRRHGPSSSLSPSHSALVAAQP